MKPTLDFEVLGPAEKEIAKQIRTTIADAICAGDHLLESLKEIELDGLESVLLDAKGKDAAIALVAPLRNIAQYLTNAQLATLIATAVLKPQPESR